MLPFIKVPQAVWADFLEFSKGVEQLPATGAVANNAQTLKIFLQRFHGAWFRKQSKRFKESFKRAGAGPIEIIPPGGRKSEKRTREQRKLTKFHEELHGRFRLLGSSATQHALSVAGVLADQLDLYDLYPYPPYTKLDVPEELLSDVYALSQLTATERARLTKKNQRVAHLLELSESYLGILLDTLGDLGIPVHEIRDNPFEDEGFTEGGPEEELRPGSLFDPLIWDEGEELRSNHLMDPLLWEDEEEPYRNPSVWDVRAALNTSVRPPVAQIPAPIIRKLSRSRSTPRGVYTPNPANYIKWIYYNWPDWARKNKTVLDKMAKLPVLVRGTGAGPRQRKGRRGGLTLQPIGGTSIATQQMSNPNVRRANQGHEEGHDVHRAYSDEANWDLEDILDNHWVSDTNMWRVIARTYRRSLHGAYPEIFADMYMLNNVPRNVLKQAAKINERVAGWMDEISWEDQQSLYKALMQALDGKAQAKPKKKVAKRKPAAKKLAVKRKAAAKKAVAKRKKPTTAKRPKKVTWPTREETQAATTESVLEMAKRKGVWECVAGGPGACQGKAKNCPGGCRDHSKWKWGVGKDGRSIKVRINPFEDEGFTRGGFWGSAGSGILYVWAADTPDPIVLLLERSADVQDPFVWGIPGGAVPRDPYTGERMDKYESALKETAEELGALPPGGDSFPYDEYVFHAPGGSGFTFTTYLVDLSQAISMDDLGTYEPMLNWENTDYEWYPVDVALDEVDLHPGVRLVLEEKF